MLAFPWLALFPGQAAPGWFQFQLPTANHAIFQPGGHTNFFTPTPGRDWLSGSFGCVRTEGLQFHEGIDIQSIEHDRRGEPTDPVLASAAGQVAYVNRRPGLSNYGNYLVLYHLIDGLQVYTLYAHLSSIREDLQPGVAVEAQEQIGVLGRTSNTRQRISKARAHLHFEICFLINDDYEVWHKKTYQVKKIDHGAWSGLNLLGIDPAQTFRAQARLGPRFRLIDHLRDQKEMMRVQVRSVDFPWLRRFPQLIEQNPVLEREPAAGMELCISYTGFPFKIIPRTETELASRQTIHLLSVDEEERNNHPCRKLVARNGGQWQLTRTGRYLFELLIY